jgi:hypothetical protein
MESSLHLVNAFCSVDSSQSHLMSTSWNRRVFCVRVVALVVVVDALSESSDGGS